MSPARLAFLGLCVALLLPGHAPAKEFDTVVLVGTDAGLPGRFYPSTGVVCMSWTEPVRMSSCPRASGRLLKVFSAAESLSRFHHPPTAVTNLRYEGRRVKLGNLNVAIEMALLRGESRVATSPKDCFRFRATWRGPGAEDRPERLSLCRRTLLANGRAYPLRTSSLWNWATLNLRGRGSAPAAEAEATGLRAFVSLRHENRLAVVDVSRRRVVEEIPVPAGPDAVAATWDGSRVAVTSPRAGRVTVLDGRTLDVLRVFSGLASPHDVELSSDGRFAYVTEARSGRLAVLDLERMRIIRRVRVGPHPHDLALSDLLWVTHRANAPLTVLSCESMSTSCEQAPGRVRVVRRYSGRGSVREIDDQPDSGRVYVTYWNSGLVAGLSATGRFRFRRSVGASAAHLAVDFYAGDRLWVSGGATGRMYIVSQRTGRVVRNVQLGGKLGEVALASARLVGVVTSDPNRLVLLRRSTGARVGVIGLGGIPGDVAFSLLRRT